MHVFVVYCHPSDKSLTYEVKKEFLRGLKEAGHSYDISDLYAMGFNAQIRESEYLRDAFYTRGGAVDDDVLMEQQKIRRADAIAFIYPVFWTDAPAMLKGWFDRVWTCGFAYGEERSMKQLRKALVIAVAGKTIDTLTQMGEAQAMETVMLGDRIRDRAKRKEFVILDGTSMHDTQMRQSKAAAHLIRAFDLGRQI